MKNMIPHVILTATWTIDGTDMPLVRTAPVDISKLTEDEQADLIIDKLAHLPVPETFMEQIADRIADEIQREIDREILISLSKQ